MKIGHFVKSDKTVIVTYSMPHFQNEIKVHLNRVRVSLSRPNPPTQIPVEYPLPALPHHNHDTEKIIEVSMYQGSKMGMLLQRHRYWAQGGRVGVAFFHVPHSVPVPLPKPVATPVGDG